MIWQISQEEKGSLSNWVYNQWHLNKHIEHPAHLTKSSGGNMSSWVGSKGWNSSFANNSVEIFRAGEEGLVSPAQLETAPRWFTSIRQYELSNNFPTLLIQGNGSNQFVLSKNFIVRERYWLATSRILKERVFYEIPQTVPCGTSTESMKNYQRLSSLGFKPLSPHLSSQDSKC